MAENNDANQKFVELHNFLKDRETTDKNTITHTCVGILSGTSGKFCIKESEFGQFQDLYVSARDSEYYLNLSEKQKDIGPLMTDYDFEFDGTHPKREYTIETIKYIIKTINKILREYIDIVKDDIIAYVTEKEHPTVVRENDDEKSPIKKVKDGFHICYVSAFTKEQRHLVYDKLKEIITQEDKLSSIPFTNKYDTILDISTIYRNNWMMYGSQKTVNVKTPSLPYKLTHVFDYYLEEQDIGEYSFADLVDRFSVRQFDGKYKLNTRPDKLQDELNVVEKYELNGKKQNKKPISSTNKLNQSKSGSSSTLTEIDIAKRLVKLFSAERANSRDDWIRVCWALHNIDLSLFDDFIIFSKLCKEKYDHDSCVKEWKKAKDNMFSIASLHWWAQKDSPTKYKDLIWEGLDKRLVKIESDKPVDIAKVVFELYKNKFKCAKIDGSHSGWYEFQGHRWVHIDGATSLRNEVSGYVSNKYLEVGLAFALQLKHSGDDDDDNDPSKLDQIQKKAKMMINLSMKLRETSSLNNVITECEHKFYDSEFVKTLNENRYLVGFDNGVYDLLTNEFREGTPEDCVTFSVGFDWENFKGTEDVFNEISEYFKKIAPNPSIREYLLRFIASFVRGGNTDQQFIFWTGSGCHSGDTQILMYDGSFKCAKDIRMGDTLMGDDSTPRTVRELFSGIQEMYEVMLSDGTFYVANANHRMALKSIYDGEVIYDNTSLTYVVIYHKIENNVPIKHEKYFRVKESSMVQAYENANNYLNKKKLKKNVIHCGSIIPIKIIDYLKLDESITKYYKQFRNNIEFQLKPVVTDSYKLGSVMGTSEIPTQYKFNASVIRSQVLAGILDKHGSIENNEFVINAHNRVFMNDCIFLCRSLGFHVDVITPDKIKINGDFTTIPTKVFKMHILQNNKKHDLTYEFKVSNIGKGKFYGFAVDKNERYILHNCIVTYNSNGKSLLMDFIKNTFGDYYASMKPTVLTRKSGSPSSATPELANKCGVRIIFMSEPEEDDKIYSSNMKLYSSGLDEVVARPLYGTEFSYIPQFKMVTLCNDLPDIFGKDEGTWRRIRVVLFEAQFIDGEPEKPNQFKKDKTLTEKMKTWYPAFMWMLMKKYYPIYCAKGLSEPKEVTLKTNNYRHDNDVFSEFIDATYDRTKSDSDVVSLSSFYNTFVSWFKDETASEKVPVRKLVKNYLGRSNEHRLVDNNILGLRLKKCAGDILK